jgi:uncharacterized phage protein (TIGR01671 family)
VLIYCFCCAYNGATLTAEGVKMRELKFRAWDGKQIRYDVTGFKHGSLNEMQGVFLDGDYYFISESADKQHGDISMRAVVMQFTGLHDKNGVEIYEGDIVKGRGDINFSAMNEKYGPEKNWPDRVSEWIYKTNIDSVVMDRFPVYWLKDESFGYDGECLVNHENCEVIGNIHQNPELLDD